MALYATAQDVRNESALPTDGTGSVKVTNTLIVSLLDEADSEIESYLSQRYTFPLTTNDLLKVISINIALHSIAIILNLKFGKGLIQLIKNNYDHAIKTLGKLRDSEINLEKNTRIAFPFTVVEGTGINDKNIGGTTIW